MRFHVTCGNGAQKGIHIRTGVTEKARDFQVNIEPVFANADNLGNYGLIYYNLSHIVK